MAHTKAGGSTALGRDSQSKRLGVKQFEGQFTKPGMILVRQRGSKYRPGLNVRQGGDDTLYAVTPGYVMFSHKKIKKYDGDLERATFVHVVSKDALTVKPEMKKAAATAPAKKITTKTGAKK